MALEILALVAALACLFMPVSQLVYLMASPHAGWESGFVLAYCVNIVFAAAVVVLVRRSARREPSWPNVSWFALQAMGLGLLVSFLGIYLASSINVVDSTHGGSLALLMMANLGIALGATAWLARRTRRATRVIR